MLSPRRFNKANTNGYCNKRSKICIHSYSTFRLSEMGLKPLCGVLNHSQDSLPCSDAILRNRGLWFVSSPFSATTMLANFQFNKFKAKFRLFITRLNTYIQLKSMCGLSVRLTSVVIVGVFWCNCLIQTYKSTIGEFTKNFNTHTHTHLCTYK